MACRKDILDLTAGDLETWVVDQGLKRYCGPQLLQWLYQKRVTSFEEMTNLALPTRALLTEHFFIGRLEVGSRHHSATDGSTKYLYRLADGRSVESVLMLSQRPFGAGQKPPRLTLCISSQVGCAMGCKFCRTAEMKLVRNLTQGEILGQVLESQRQLPPGERITNIVFMGMGEPLHNYDAVISSIKILTDPKGFGISQRKITVSTVGLAPEIERFGRDTGVKLALSLNATTEAGRSALMPVTLKYSLKQVLEACRAYCKVQSKRRITIEYVIMAEINDSLEDARRLVQIGSHFPCKINLIPYNEYPTSPYHRPTEEKVRPFFQYLADRNFQVNIRYSKGLDVMGACGQLCAPSPLATLPQAGEGSCKHRLT